MNTSSKIKVLTVFGTRPEAIKMAPLVKALEADTRFDSIVCVTAQHRQMLDQVLDLFSIIPDFDLNVMHAKQSLADITTRVLNGLCEVMEDVQPQITLVHGDTTTTFAAGLAAYYNKIPVGHVEAGLRTNNIYFPFPEEMNRKLTGAIASMHFSPTESNRANLLREGVSDENIYITGNTVIDVLKSTVQPDYQFSVDALNQIDYQNHRILAVEVHRRENLGAPMEDICNALLKITDSYPDTLLVYPVHMNPQVREPVFRILSNHNRIHLLDPIGLEDMHNLIARSFLVLSDSGGLQEESPSLGTPMLVLRNETERPEAVNAGTVKLAGTVYADIISAASLLCDDSEAYNKMRNAINPYGDGNASSRIVQAIASKFLPGIPRPKPFSVQ